MPLSSPGGGGFATIPAAMTRVPARNTGSDTALNIVGCYFHQQSGLIIVGGNNDYVGTKADALAKLVQNANLPTFFTGGGGGVGNFCDNFVDGGLLARDGNQLGRTDNADGSTAWTEITPAAATTRRGVFSLDNNDGNLYCVTVDLDTPDRNMEVSGDNGALWDSNPGLKVPVGEANCNFAEISRDGSLVLVGASDGSYAITDTPDNNASWETFSAATIGQNLNSAAFSDDKQSAVVVSQNGQIGTVAGGLQSGNDITIDPSNNPFVQGTNNGVEISIVEYSSKLKGFVLFGFNMVGFIDEQDMTVCKQGAFFGDSTGLIDNASAADDNGDIFGGGNSNIGVITVNF